MIILKTHPFLQNAPPLLINDLIIPMLDPSDNTRVFSIPGGRASGKTQTILRTRMLQANANADIKIAMGRTTENRSDSIKKTLIEIQDIEHDKCGVVKTTDKYIEMESGGRIELMGFNPEVPESARGFSGYDYVDIDECFTGDTLINTPNGLKRIDLLKENDSIISAIGNDYIKSIRKLTKTELVNIVVRYADTNKKQVIRCSKRHKFLTPNGWCYAENLERGMEFISIQDMPKVWKKDILSKRKGNKTISKSEILQSLLLGESRKFNVEGWCKRKSQQETERDWAQTACSWWKRNSIRYSSEMAISIKRKWLDSRISNTNWLSKICTSISNLLQSRFGKQRIKISNRTRREFPQTGIQKEIRSEERQLFNTIRVESVKIKKYRRGITLYDLEIKQHPTFFANGILTHNCQYATSTYLKELYDTILRFRTILCLPHNPDVDDEVGKFMATIKHGKTVLCNYVDNPMCPKEVIEQAEYDRQNRLNYYLNNWLGQPIAKSDMVVFQPPNLMQMKTRGDLQHRAIFGSLDFAPGSHDSTIKTDDNVIGVFGMNTEQQVELIKKEAFVDDNKLSIVGRIINIYNREKMQAIIVDATGAGEMIPPLLEAAGLKVIAFYGGSKNMFKKDNDDLGTELTEKYSNNRTYAYFLAADDAIENKLFTKDEDVLKELGSQEYRYSVGGVRKMELKSDIKKKLGRSPDNADMFVMGNLLARNFPELLTLDKFSDFGHNSSATDYNPGWV